MDRQPDDGTTGDAQHVDWQAAGIGAVKKTYEKPMLVKAVTLSKATADNGAGNAHNFSLLG